MASPAAAVQAEPVVALIGNPNTGKSTLFNRLMGRRAAIVHDRPGVTRDRHYGDAVSLGHSYTLIDTGGFDPGGDDTMKQGIAQQVEIAIEEADVIICVLDATAPPTSIDSEEIALLRRSEKPVLYVANVDEAGLASGNASSEALEAHARAQGAGTVRLCGKIEAELSVLDEEERREFLAGLFVVFAAPDRAPAGVLHEFEQFFAALLTDKLANHRAKRAHVVAQRLVLVLEHDVLAA